MEDLIIGLFVAGAVYVIFRKRKEIKVKTDIVWKSVYKPRRGKGGKK
tara:strand:+ start:90 stop:230 length:141 start_codon:yes stop_codon:yes gene_type:complete